MGIAIDVHPFERAGLGQAPFRCIGMNECWYVACPGAQPQPSGTCDYCGNGIAYKFAIVSADGKQFGVGCDCVRKTDRECSISDFEKIKALHDRKVRDARRIARQAAEDAKIAAGFAILDGSPELQAAMKGRPHPYKGLAEKGLTMLDWIAFMRHRAGRSGQMAAVRIIAAANKAAEVA